MIKNKLKSLVVVRKEDFILDNFIEKISEDVRSS